MFVNNKLKTKALICAGFCVTVVAVHAQDRRDDRITCSSDGGRTVCNADTRGGVRISRQLSDVRCVEGYTWGYTEQSVWVDRGCRAEFVLPVVDPGTRSERFTRIEPGTTVVVRTDEPITSDRADGRIFTGVVDQDVRGSNENLAIPRYANVELIVRVARDRDLILDLESVMVNGQRYALSAEPTRVESRSGVGANRRTGEYVGGGAALGAIIGAIAGGGKGAAIGAGAGAAAGAGGQILTRGREVRIPPESLITFRLERPLTMGVTDSGTMRDGRHYHDYRDQP